MSGSLLSVNELISAVNGTAISESDFDFAFTSVSADSRTVRGGSLFAPLVGERQDGHKYIPAAIENGASVIFLNDSEYKKDAGKYDGLAENFPRVMFVRVRNTLSALQDAAAFYVAKFPGLKKIGVTGSSGKTTTKEMVAACLRQKYNVVANEGNLNSETGVPLSAFKIRSGHEVGVFEMGMNRVSEIAEVAGIIKPQFALVTNIGTAHIGLLGSREKIAEEKKNAFNYVDEGGAVFIPRGDAFEDFLAAGVKGNVIRYGAGVSESESGVRFISDKGLGGTVFALDGIEITLPIAGSYNYQNALGAVAVARYFGVGASEIKSALENITPLSGRAETIQIELKNGADVLLFKDCYNANPDSMSKAIALCAGSSSLPAGGAAVRSKKIFVLGDMYELGDDSDAAHKKIGREILEASPDMTIFVGKEMKLAFDVAVASGCKNCVSISDASVESIEEIAELILGVAADGDVILMKASRAMEFERIIPFMVRQDDKIERQAC